MALGNYPTLLQINTELGTTLASLKTCIENAGKTGVWDSQLDFAGYTKPTGDSLTVSPVLLQFNLDGTPIKLSSVSIISNRSWTITDDSSWVTTSISSGSGNSSFTVTCSSAIFSRSGTITVTAGAIVRTIHIDQDGTDIP